MKRLLLVFLWFLTGSVVWQQQNVVRGIFGVRIAFQSNSQMTTFVCFLDNGRTLTHKRILSQDEFIHFASGDWPSIYNPKRINYFEERNLNCGIATDSFSLKKVSYCVPFDSLWKLRFSTYPYRQSVEMGWSPNLYKPSLKQEKFLYDNYGVANIDGDFFLDTAFWKLLNDVQDPVWIQNYKSLQ
jgi:hypothetical protein